MSTDIHIQNFAKLLANDSWFLVERPGDEILWFDPEEDEPFETLDAKWTVYYGSVEDD